MLNSQKKMSIAILTGERWINPESCTPEREITLANLKEKQWCENTQSHYSPIELVFLIWIYVHSFIPRSDH